MNQKIGAVIASLLVFCCSLYPEEMTSLIGDIGLIDSPLFKGSRPPTRLSLGIEMIADSYYKLKAKESVISAGLLRRGFNVIPIDAHHLFEKSGLHKYELELKTDDGILRWKIEVRIQLNTEFKTKTDAVLPKPQHIDHAYGLSMYIDGELVASVTKKHYEKFPFQFKIPDIPQAYGPFDPSKRDDPMVNSFSILGAAALAYELLQDLTQKDEKKSPEDPLRLWKQRTASYLQADSSGITKEIRAVITIRLRDS